MRPLFGTHPKISNSRRPLTSVNVGRRNIPVSGGSRLAQKILLLRVVSSLFPCFFNYRSDSPVTGWPITSALAWLTRGQLTVSSTLSAFSYFSSLSLSLSLPLSLSLLTQKLASHSLDNLNVPYQLIFLPIHSTFFFRMLEKPK